MNDHINTDVITFGILDCLVVEVLYCHCGGSFSPREGSGVLGCDSNRQLFGRFRDSNIGRAAVFFSNEEIKYEISKIKIQWLPNTPKVGWLSRSLLSPSYSPSLPQLLLSSLVCIPGSKGRSSNRCLYPGRHPLHVHSHFHIGNIFRENRKFHMACCLPKKERWGNKDEKRKG